MIDIHFGVFKEHIINLPHRGTGGPLQKVNRKTPNKYVQFREKNHRHMKGTRTWVTAQFIYV